MWRPLSHLPLVFPLSSQEKEKANLARQGLLVTPSTKRLDCERAVISGIEFGHSSIQGYRVSMEDAHIIQPMSIEGHAIVAIFDGHAGAETAVYAAENMWRIVEETDEWKEYVKNVRKNSLTDYSELLSKCLVTSFLNIDEELKEKEILTSGCTAVVTIITPTHFVTASVGDSRCVIGVSNGDGDTDTGATAIAQTEDHKPSTEAEHIRIQRAGGFVRFNRVNGELAMSRALGDFVYKSSEVTDDITKQMVIAVPDVGVHVRNVDRDEFVVWACDGVWDVMSNEHCVAFVHELFEDIQDKNISSRGRGDDEEEEEEGEEEELVLRGRSGKEESSSSDGEEVDEDLMKELGSALSVADTLIDVSLAAGSTDNISAIVARLPRRQLPVSVSVSAAPAASASASDSESEVEDVPKKKRPAGNSTSIAAVTGSGERSSNSQGQTKKKKSR